jgi:hypothetical protein
MGYQYALHQHKKQLREEKSELRRSQEEKSASGRLMTHKYRGSQQSSGEVKPKFIDSTQVEPNNIYKP